jgi:hypothetical protein
MHVVYSALKSYAVTEQKTAPVLYVELDRILPYIEFKELLLNIHWEI